MFRFSRTFIIVLGLAGCLPGATLPPLNGEEASCLYVTAEGEGWDVSEESYSLLWSIDGDLETVTYVDRSQAQAYVEYSLMGIDENGEYIIAPTTLSNLSLWWGVDGPADCMADMMVEIYYEDAGQTAIYNLAGNVTISNMREQPILKDQTISNVTTVTIEFLNFSSSCQWGITEVDFGEVSTDCVE